VLRIEWKDRLRVQSTGLVLDDSGTPLIDRMLVAIAAAGKPLTAEEMAERISSTAGAVRVQAGRHPHRIVGDGRRPRRWTAK
jgi:hypothetical protein